MNTLLRQVSLTGLLVMMSITFSQLSSAQTSLEKTTVTYRNIDGHNILADVYRPKGDEIRPVIVSIHGGALIMGHREWVNPKILALAEEKGYAIVSIDYRLAPETKLPGIISDIEAAFNWLASDGAKRFHIDPDRMVVVGESAGGYLTLVTGYRVNPKPKALVALYGYGELNADWYAKPSPDHINRSPNDNSEKGVTREEAMKQTDGTVTSDDRQRKGDGVLIYLYYRQNGLWPQEVSGFNPDSIAGRIAPYEPVKNVTRDYPPTLLIHGTEDKDVPYEESVKMSVQFERHGVPYILRPIDKGNHGLVGGDEAQIEDAYKTIREFIIRYLEAK